MRGRYRPHLSLREGLEQPPRSGAKKPRFSNPFYSRAPFPLALDDPGSVLSVKGTLRRFAPWTAPGRSERRAAHEGKGGMQIIQLVCISFDIVRYHYTPNRGRQPSASDGFSFVFSELSTGSSLLLLVL